MTTFMESHFLMMLNVDHVLFVQLALARGSLWSLHCQYFMKVLTFTEVNIWDPS